MSSSQGALRSISQTTASFSIGSSEQVEYTILPPGRNNCAALLAISACNLNILLPTFGVHNFHNPLFFLEVPVPEHGASTITPSKPGGGILLM